MSSTDELRSMAVSIGLAVPQAATLMMGAAGSIDRLDAENSRMRKLVQRMWPTFTGEKRATFADRLHVRAEIDELGIEVDA